MEEGKFYISPSVSSEISFVKGEYQSAQGKFYVEWKCDKDRYHITVRADEEVNFYYDFKDREVLSFKMRESILNAVMK